MTVSLVKDPLSCYLQGLRQIRQAAYVGSPYMVGASAQFLAPLKDEGESEVQRDGSSNWQHQVRSRSFSIGRVLPLWLQFTETGAFNADFFYCLLLQQYWTIQ
jgi:hypothetical protein